MLQRGQVHRVRDWSSPPPTAGKRESGEFLWPARPVSHSLLIIVQAKLLLLPLKFGSLEIKGRDRARNVGRRGPG
jgi:hypothetical protein